jgi:predicted AAA+ superfamily ATPase
VLAGMVSEDNDYFGHMEDLYMMIKWLTDKTHPNPIVHVRGIKSVGKTRFIK